VRYSSEDSAPVTLGTAGLTAVSPESVISFVQHDASRRVLSCYGDPVWDLSPYCHTANTARSEMLIRWSRLPPSFVPAVKLILYRYWMVGRPGGIRPTAKTIILTFYVMARFRRWVNALGAQRLTDISPLHCMGWVQHCRERKLAPRSQKVSYLAVEALYTFRDPSGDALRAHPWPESSARRLAGIAALDHTPPSTKLIPAPIVERLFQGALAVINRADVILDRRNSSVRPARDPESVLLRSACYVILGLTSGCRNHELVSIEEGAIRRTTHDGEVFYWLKGHSLKTRAGASEWMVPEIAARCVHILERWAAPLRRQLRTRLAQVGRRLARVRHNTREHAAFVSEQQKLKADQHRLFLGRSNSTGVGCLCLGQWNKYMRCFAKHVGVDWPLATHQFRRTFAANVAIHILGDLIYLKHHYKHWSMDMTALYALNTQQEQELFDEVLHAVREKKIRIIEHWLDDDCMVIGGAAAGVKAFRAKYRLETVATRKKLAEDTADLVSIRATGHGWCLAADAGFGGQGLYEPTRCLGCRNGVIDSSHAPVWRNILSQQRELLATAKDCGPSGARRIDRDLAYAERVLGELGVSVEHEANEK
jgi:hypothetical protein